ncbi:hypothetical protein PMAYCL1PPCAC_20194, partial [Pristionchus mayeri]
TISQLRQMTLDASGRANISETFNLVPAWTNNVNLPVPAIKIQNVFAQLIGVFQDVVQYSDVNNNKGRQYTVAELCRIMEDENTFSDPIDAVRWASLYK